MRRQQRRQKRWRRRTLQRWKIWRTRSRTPNKSKRKNSKMLNKMWPKPRKRWRNPVKRWKQNLRLVYSCVYICTLLLAIGRHTTKLYSLCNMYLCILGLVLQKIKLVKLVLEHLLGTYIISYNFSSWYIIFLRPFILYCLFNELPWLYTIYYVIGKITVVRACVKTRCYIHPLNTQY